MLFTALPTGPYPYAGVPWFNAFPGAMASSPPWSACVATRPGQGVLAYLASTQATEVIPEQDAEPQDPARDPERRDGGAARNSLRRYYGSVDATPLFVLLAGAYYERTGDRSFIASLAPRRGRTALDRPLRRPDGDGFVEYQRQSAHGLVHQGWKDTDTAIFHADGSLAHGPIALCEVQGYVYAAQQAGAALATDWGGWTGQRSLRVRLRRCGSGSSRHSGASCLPTPGPGRRQAALPGTDVQRRAVPLHRHREPRARPAGGTDTPGPCIVLGLGRPHDRRL